MCGPRSGATPPPTSTTTAASSRSSGPRLARSRLGWFRRSADGTGAWLSHWSRSGQLRPVLDAGHRHPPHCQAARNPLAFERSERPTEVTTVACVNRAESSLLIVATKLSEREKAQRIQAVHDLRSLGWSEARIALAVGRSRAWLHRHCGPASDGPPAEPVARRSTRPDLVAQKPPERQPTGGRVLGVFTA